MSCKCDSLVQNASGAVEMAPATCGAAPTARDPVPHEHPKPGLAKLIEQLDADLSIAMTRLQAKVKPVSRANLFIRVTSAKNEDALADPPLRAHVLRMSGRIAELRAMIEAIDL